MQMTNETQTRLTAEMKLIPRWMYALAALAFLSAEIFFNVLLARQPNPPPAWLRPLFGTLLGVVVGCYLLLVGYVNRDARRRGMSPTLWTLVAIFIPNGLGILLYFILRQRLPGVLPRMGGALPAEIGSCPRCGYQLSGACPHCQRVVGAEDGYCRFCGTPLHQPAAAAV
jgi:hypothetical protein